MPSFEASICQIQTFRTMNSTNNPSSLQQEPYNPHPRPRAGSISRVQTNKATRKKTAKNPILASFLIAKTCNQAAKSNRFTNNAFEA